MQLRYSFRLYPTAGQQQALARAFGCARVVYNDALRAREDAREAGLPFPKAAALSAAMTEAKKTPDRCWLGEVSSVVLQQSLRDLEAAYRAFFDGLAGKRPRIGAPRFKSRKDRRQAVRFTANARWSITPGGRLALPKIGPVKVKWSRALPSVPATVTVVKDAAGRFRLSFVVETDDEPLLAAEAEVGIDLGLEHFAVTSDGRKITSPRFLRRAERKLRKAQRDLSRTQKGSKNRDKARTRVARAHAQVADARREFHHTLSTMLVRDNQAVYVEDLCVKGWRARGWPSRCTMRAGRRSRRCWSTRRSGTAARSRGWTGRSRPRSCARAAGTGTAPDPCTCAGGRAGSAGPSMIGTSTPPATSWTRDAASPRDALPVAAGRKPRASRGGGDLKRLMEGE